VDSRLSVGLFLTLFYCVTLLQLRPTLVHFITDCSFCCLFFLWFILLFFLPPIHHQNIQSILSLTIIYFSFSSICTKDFQFILFLNFLSFLNNYLISPTPKLKSINVCAQMHRRVKEKGGFYLD